jgi:peroxiredoxin
MAQLRHDYSKFKALNAEILVAVPNGPRMIEKYIEQNASPYPILSDKGSKVAEQYGVETKHTIVFKLFTPTVFLIDKTGRICYTNYSTSYIREPDNNEPLAVLEQLAVDN